MTRNLKILPYYYDDRSLILSDGEFYMQAMLNTQLNHLLETQRVQKDSTFKITLIANNLVQNKR